MAKTMACVGAYGKDDQPSSISVPDNLEEVADALNGIIDKYSMGEALSDEDKEIVKAYLPAIGADETSLSSYDALIGSGSFEYDASNTGTDFHIKGACGCTDSGEGRIEWSGNMSIEKTGGDTTVYEYELTFRGASFGMGPTGVMKLIYKRDFTRSFKGDSAFSAFDDRFVFTQWGFFFSCACTVKTDKGDIVIR